MIMLMPASHSLAAPLPEAFEPISLGYACDVKYQVSRNLYFRIHPDHSETDFRNMLFRWLRQPTFFKRHIFDWAITPHAAVCAYIEADFQGVFEREDLVIGEDGNVHHPRLRTIHPHDFTKGPDGRVSVETLDAEYPAARSKFDHLAERFRRHLETPGPYLYVMGEIRPFAEVQRLMNLLHSRSPEHRFELLLTDKAGAVNQVLLGLTDTASKGWLPASPPDKLADRLWEGDDDAWSAILDRFRIGLPGIELATTPRLDAAEKGIERQQGIAPPAQADWRLLAEASGDLLQAGFDYVGDRDAIVGDGEALRFRGSGADDHVFTHFLPTATAAVGGWARIRVRWPADAPRAVLLLQDQDCRTPGLTVVQGENADHVSIAQLGPDVDHLRLVFLPVAGEGGLPARITLEVQPARFAN
jgi:hypothetical protein